MSVFSLFPDFIQICISKCKFVGDLIWLLFKYRLPFLPPNLKKFFFKKKEYIQNKVVLFDKVIMLFLFRSIKFNRKSDDFIKLKPFGAFVKKIFKLYIFQYKTHNTIMLHIC